MSKPFDTPEFKWLLSEWNQKLKESGFKDIEEPVGRQPKLKRSGSANRFRAMDSIERDSKTKFYEILGERIQETVFDSEREKETLYLYFEGVPKVEIARRVTPPAHKQTIYAYINKWLSRWGLK